MSPRFLDGHSNESEAGPAGPYPARGSLSFQDTGPGMSKQLGADGSLLLNTFDLFSVFALWRHVLLQSLSDANCDLRQALPREVGKVSKEFLIEGRNRRTLSKAKEDKLCFIYIYNLYI